MVKTRLLYELAIGYQFKNGKKMSKKSKLSKGLSVKKV